MLARRDHSKRVSRKDQSLARLENFKKDVVTDSHIIPLDELCSRFNTDPVTGLSQEQAKQILLKTGKNALTPSRKTPELIKYLKTLFQGFALLLWIGALLCMSAVIIHEVSGHNLDRDNLGLAIVLTVVVLVTGTFTYAQERRSQGIMDSFTKLMPSSTNVIRGGESLIIPTEDVVIGDLVDIKFGDRVPADLRIIHNQGLKVDNSPITGEAEALPRSEKFTDENFLETRNIAFFSTYIVEGTGRGIVVACGDHTVMGHIAGLTARIKPNKTPMAKELDHFMKVVSLWATFLGLIIGIITFSVGYTTLESILFIIGIIVANVPEGLLPTLTVCLTVTAKRMAHRNCLMKNLEAVETLGSTSVICSDKTGTLTQNKMTVCHLWCSGKVLATDAMTKGEEIYQKDEFKALMRCAVLCTRAEFLPNQDKIPIMSRRVKGDASEEAILKFVTKTAVLPPNFKEQNPKLVEIPFSSTSKYQVSVHCLTNGRCIVVMKGAPERILERCSSIFYNGDELELSDDMRKTCEEACLQFASLGERVLGFCDLELNKTFTKDFPYTTDPANFPQRNLRFLGFLALMDPPRPQVPDAVELCRMAGIRVVMVTGDHPVTARAIAEKVGIITTSSIIEFKSINEVRKRNHDQAAIVMPGIILRDLTQDELDSILVEYKEIVFARTSPAQKLQIVESFQRLGEIVAVTGDGVNDAPALKKADIGVAMGITGTEVSKEAADMILLDDNFASIVIGIEEGRRIFDNLKKCITYTIASNVPELLPFIAFIVINIPLPIGIIQILCIDLVTDLLPAISLGYEKAERNIMERPPRNPKQDKLASRKLYFLAYGHLGLFEALNGFMIYCIVMAEHGFLPSSLIGLRADWDSDSDIKDSYDQIWTREQRLVLEYTCYTAVFISIVVSQVSNVIVCKTRINSIAHQGIGNWFLISSIIIELVTTATLSYAPYMYNLKFYPTKIRWWLCSIPFSIFLFGFDEFRKWHIRKYPKGWYQRETFY